MRIALVAVLGVLGLWQGAAPTRISVLYLGHNSKHHDSATYAPMLREATHGKGRVFYTASGHDARVWSHPTFHHLMRNAVVWAANTR